MRAFITFFVICFAILFAIQWSLNRLMPPYQSIATSFFESFWTKDYENAYNLFSSNFKANVSFEKFQNFMEHSEYRDYQSVSWSDVIVKENTASLKGVILLKSSRQMIVGINFIKEKNYTVKLDINKDLDKPMGEFTPWKITEIMNLNELRQPVNR